MADTGKDGNGDDTQAPKQRQQRRARGKRKAKNVHPLPMERKEAMLPHIGQLLDKIAASLSFRSAGSSGRIGWVIDMLTRVSRAVSLHVPLVGRALRLVWTVSVRWPLNLVGSLLPGNILWPVLVPCKVDAAVHIIRATDGSAKPVDCVVWVSRRWEVLWRGGSFGKGILSRSNPTWVQRYHKETDPSTSAGTNYLEDITRQRREERRARRTEEIADEERGTGLAIVPAAELQVSSDEVRQMEPVQLSPYEALFLAEIGCLVVKDADNRTYQYADLWQLFRSVDMSDEFDLRYAAYYYYRSKGWVVKSGLKFASDFLLYANGPAHAHSQYSVVVRPLSAEKAGQDEAQEPVDLVDSWQYAFALSRVTSQVKKSLITCYVERPPTSCGHRPDEGPPDLSLYHIREFQIQRFNPNRNLQ